MTVQEAARRRENVLPMQTREAPIGNYEPESRTFDLVWTTGATVRRRRYDWRLDRIVEYDETLIVSEEAIDMSRLHSGAPYLDSHDSWSTRSQVGVIERAWLKSGEGHATVRFARAGLSEDADRIAGMVADKIIRSNSVGYVPNRIRIEPATETKVEQWFVERWTPYEISAVTIPADGAAQFRAEDRETLYPFEVINRGSPASNQEIAMADPVVAPPAGQSAPETRTEPAAAPAAPATEQRLNLTAPVATIGVAAITEFRSAAASFRAIGIDADPLDAMSRGITVDAWRAEIINARAAEADRTAPRQNIAPNGGAARVGAEERELRMAGIEDALVAQLTRAKPSDNGARFMESRSIVEFVADAMGERRIPSGFGRREDFLRRAFHTTSDFPLLLENALNKSLAARYAMAAPTYRKIARQRTYQDFRDHNSVRVGDFPTLQSVDPNGGELKNGTFSESKEKTAVSAYGVRVNLSRQLLVNDTLDGITQVLNDRGNAVARFEETTFYAMMISGSSSNGPTLLETSRQVFNTTDVTLAGTPSTIDVANLSIARAAMRKKTSMDGAKLDIMGNILLVGPDKETVAQQVVAPIMPALPTSPNPFSGKLEVVVTAHITGNPWYVFADPSVAPCFEWGLLDGYSAPRFRMEEIFGVQGTQLSLEHDFGCGAIDFRGGFRNAGA